MWDRVEELREQSLGDLGNWAATVLPVGYQVILTIKRESGWVDLTLDGERLEFPTNYEYIEEEFRDAVEFAIEHNKDKPCEK